MARKVLNKPVSAGQGPILNMGMQRITRHSVDSSPDVWHTSSGRRCYIQRDTTSSVILYTGSWMGNTVSSYQCGMGCRFYNSGNNAVGNKNHGWGYIWQNNSGSDMGSCTQLFKAMGSISGVANETGTCSVRIGWQSSTGSPNKPAHVWAGDANDDARAGGMHYGYWNVMEVDGSKVTHDTNSRSDGL